MPEALIIHEALDVFTQGFAVCKSTTHPYEAEKLPGDVWVLRDAPRKNPKNYRKEEWITYLPPKGSGFCPTSPTALAALARKQTRGRFFLGIVVPVDESVNELRETMKALGYRLLATEAFFQHDFKGIPQVESTAKVTRLRSQEDAVQFAKLTRSKVLSEDHLQTDHPIRQFIAKQGSEIVGWVRSVDAGTSTWCSNMEVRPAFRRQGIGSLLLRTMLSDDRKRKFHSSVLLSTHSGALLYPKLGYQRIGTLFIWAPGKT